MKELVSLHTYLADPEQVGEWEGSEVLAADNLNRLYHAVYDYADSDIDPSLLEQILEAVWSKWQYQPELLELDDELIEAFVEQIFSYFDPQEESNDY